MRSSLFLILLLCMSCSSRSRLRVPASAHSKYDAFSVGMKINLRSAVELSHKEEVIYSNNICEIQKFCTFEIEGDPQRRLTMKGEFTVKEIKEDEEKLILLTTDKANVQLDCGLKYTTKVISRENDLVCENLKDSFPIYSFPEFIQTIIDLEYVWPETSASL